MITLEENKQSLKAAPVQKRLIYRCNLLSWWSHSLSATSLHPCLVTRSWRFKWEKHKREKSSYGCFELMMIRGVHTRAMHSSTSDSERLTNTKCVRVKVWTLIRRRWFKETFTLELCLNYYAAKWQIETSSLQIFFRTFDPSLSSVLFDVFAKLTETHKHNLFVCKSETHSVCAAAKIWFAVRKTSKHAKRKQPPPTIANCSVTAMCPVSLQSNTVMMRSKVQDKYRKSFISEI